MNNQINIYKKPKAFIFDLGNVLISIAMERAYQYWAEVAGCTTQEIAAKFKVDDPYIAFEKGEIGPEEYWAHLTKVFGCSLSQTQFEAGWNRILIDQIHEMQPIIASLHRQQYRLVVLSNTNLVHAAVWQKRYTAILDHFEKIFASHEIGVRKPEEAAFQKVLDYLQVKPEETVFIDDLEIHIQAAKMIGIAGIVMKSPQQLKEELKNFGVEI